MKKSLTYMTLYFALVMILFAPIVDATTAVKLPPYLGVSADPNDTCATHTGILIDWTDQYCASYAQSGETQIPAAASWSTANYYMTIGDAIEASPSSSPISVVSSKEGNVQGGTTLPVTLKTIDSGGMVLVFVAAAGNGNILNCGSPDLGTFSIRVSDPGNPTALAQSEEFYAFSGGGYSNEVITCTDSVANNFSVLAVSLSPPSGGTIGFDTNSSIPVKDDPSSKGTKDSLTVSASGTNDLIIGMFLAKGAGQDFTLGQGYTSLVQQTTYGPSALMEYQSYACTVPCYNHLANVYSYVWEECDIQSGGCGTVQPDAYVFLNPNGTKGVTHSSSSNQVSFTMVTNYDGELSVDDGAAQMQLNYYICGGNYLGCTKSLVQWIIFGLSSEGSASQTYGCQCTYVYVLTNPTVGETYSFYGGPVASASVSLNAGYAGTATTNFRSNSPGCCGYYFDVNNFTTTA